MADSLQELEKRRSEILAQIASLGDFRRGSISPTGGRCGTPNCHCHKPDDPGHGPNLRLTYKVRGKTVTESIPRQKQWILRHQPKLDDGKIEKLVRFLRGIHASTVALADAIRIEAAYFENNADRMRYPEFRRQHLFVGSGVIEAGCKTVIGSRLKQSAMFWTVNHANAILALRCCHFNNRFENYWAYRHAA